MNRNHPIHRQSRGFTLVEILVLIVIIAIIASLVVPTGPTCHYRADNVKDSANLKAIQQAAFAYSQKKARFPFSTKSNALAHDHVNVLLKSSFREGLKPDIWLSPKGDQFERKEVDGEGRFTLEAENLSYTWAARALERNSNAVLSCNKFVDGFVDEDGVKRTGYKNQIVVAQANGTILQVDTIDEEDVQKWRIDPETLLPEGVTR
jgi:prepilin-type N-terminal cleavage/methylation domain-containing protein